MYEYGYTSSSYINRKVIAIHLGRHPYTCSRYYQIIIQTSFPICTSKSKGWVYLVLHICSVQFRSVAQSCPTLCDPMSRSTPGLPVHHQLLECTQTMSIESVMLSNHLVLCHPLLLLPSSFPTSGSFQMTQLFALGGQSIGVSASTSVLLMITQDWTSLGWTVGSP